jgi:hypothetical protein
VKAVPALVVAWAAVSAAHAEVVTLNPVQDTSIFSGTPESAGLSDGSGDYLWTSVTDAGLVRRALVKFDVTAIPAGSVVREVRVSLYQSRSRENHAVSIHRLTRGWGESTSNAGGAGTGAPAAPGDATWVRTIHPNLPWSVPGGDFVAIAGASTFVAFQGEFYTWGTTPNLVSDVQSWVDQPAANHGWILIGSEAGQKTAKRFESRNNATVSARPRLEVVYDPPTIASDGDIPVPPWALVVLAGALAGRMVSRRAQRSNRD